MKMLILALFVGALALLATIDAASARVACGPRGCVAARHVGRPVARPPVERDCTWIGGIKFCK